MYAQAAWRRALLTTTSIVSIAGGALIGIVPAPALAACSTNITGNVAGCTNSTTITGINIHSANVSSSINNTGTISPNGISVNTNSTITGSVLDSGTLAGGITIDNTSTISAGSNGIYISGPTLGGGIKNAGQISATHSSIRIENVSAFSGGLSNSGTINAGAGFFSLNVSTFTGGISNSGTISATKGTAIFADGTATFTGGITNSGTITGIAGIAVLNITTFQGDIVNAGGTGQISVAADAIGVNNVTTFGGSIINDNAILGQSGIIIENVGTFSGNISNGGSITASGTAAIRGRLSLRGGVGERDHALCGGASPNVPYAGLQRDRSFRRRLRTKLWRHERDRHPQRTRRRFDSLQILGNMPIVWHGRVAWAHDWVSNPALGATFKSLPGASFTVNGAAPPPNSALASAGAKFYITPAWSFDAKFDGEFASGSQTSAGTGTLRYAW